MVNSNIYERLGYEGLLVDSSEIEFCHPDFVDIQKIGADKVYFSGDHPAVLFVEIQSFNNNDESRRIAEIQHKAWNYRKVILLFALSDTEIRIYNCYEKPEYISKEEDVNLKLNPAELLRYNSTSSDVDKLNVLVEIFSRIGVDNGLLWTEQPKIREKIDLQNRIDAYLVKSLITTASALETDGLSKEIIHSLLMRSLFILFLEDKGAANEAGLYAKIKDNCSCYFDILDSKEATYKLFEEVQIHFNGNVTPVLPNEKELVTDNHLNLIKRCFTDGNISDNKTLFENWRLFNFEIIQIELLSEIYENFLGELRHSRGQFYTPYNLVELVLSDKLSISNTNYNVKILDPACGSGIFLVESYKRLIKRWKKANDTDRIGFDDLRDLLTNNIYGIEIDETAIKVAAFSLYLALVDELDPKTLWIKTNYQLPYLIFDSEDIHIQHQGCNLWRKDTIGEVDVNLFPKVDLVIGNPPFGTINLPLTIKEYCSKYKFSNEYVLPFIHKSVKFCPSGEIALIFNSKVLTNTQKTYQNFRKWLFNSNYVEKVYNLSIFRKTPKHFGGQLFSSAVGPVSIVYFRPIAPEIISETIEYWAPKTYVKSNIVDGVVIDNSDIKELPRIECLNPNSKIWKVALWGNFNSFRLLKRLQKTTLKNYFDNTENWIYGRGLNADSDNPDFVPNKIIKTECIERYFTDPNISNQSNTKVYRKNNEHLFSPPFVIFKEGQHDTEIACSLFNQNHYCTTGAFIINTTDEKLDEKKFLVSYLNSDFAKYILFLTASSWGIERERVLLNELLDLPSPFSTISSDTIRNIAAAFDKIVSLKKSAICDMFKIKEQEQYILNEFIKHFLLSDREVALIEDTILFGLGLFKDGHNSVGFKRTLQAENHAYATMLCDDVNSFLASSKTKVYAQIYDAQLNDSLNLIILHFGKEIKEVETKNITELRTQLQEIDKYTIQKKAHSIYVQKHIKYYDGDVVYLIKPNQKRFWTRTQAMEDASSLIADIINMAT
ncbi:MAG: N-6 DNA methylase [Muribaculaceae bacterium]